MIKIMASGPMTLDCASNTLAEFLEISESSYQITHLASILYICTSVGGIMFSKCSFASFELVVSG